MIERKQTFSDIFLRQSTYCEIINRKASSKQRILGTVDSVWILPVPNFEAGWSGLHNVLTTALTFLASTARFLECSVNSGEILKSTDGSWDLLTWIDSLHFTISCSFRKQRSNEKLSKSVRRRSTEWQRRHHLNRKGRTEMAITFMPQLERKLRTCQELRAIHRNWRQSNK